MVNEMGGIFPDDDAKLAKEKQQAEKDREKESRGKRRATMRRSISRRGFPSRSLRCAVARSGLAACIHAHFLAWPGPSLRDVGYRRAAHRESGGAARASWISSKSGCSSSRLLLAGNTRVLLVGGLACWPR
jgi:hypothetical protein